MQQQWLRSSGLNPVVSCDNRSLTLRFILCLCVCCASSGGIIVGYVSDLYGGRRACVIVSLLSLLCPLLYIFSQYSDVVSSTCKL
eukprot:13580-Heterococcus_DN1.PRE.3